MAKCACAVVGVVGAKQCSAASLVYLGLHALQHRGQESAGIAALQRASAPNSSASAVPVPSNCTPPVLTQQVVSVHSADSKTVAPNGDSGNGSVSIHANRMRLHKVCRLPRELVEQCLRLVVCSPGIWVGAGRIRVGLTRRAGGFARTKGSCFGKRSVQTLICFLFSKLGGSAAIGHTRYSTTGSQRSVRNVQPFMVQYKRGNLALSHNGNISNFASLHSKLRGTSKPACKHRISPTHALCCAKDEGTLFHSTSDSELILHLISRSKADTQPKQLIDALTQIEGAFSCVLLTDEVRV
jgi:hypothetical protein